MKRKFNGIVFAGPGTIFIAAGFKDFSEVEAYFGGFVEEVDDFGRRWSVQGFASGS